MTNVITVYQPHASLIMAGIKTWETRGNPPNGDMRPEGVRGLPGKRINAGDRILIHAAVLEPVAGADVGGWWWEPDMGDPVIVSLDDHRQIPAPLGKILGSVRIDDALRIYHETALADAGLTSAWEPHVTLGDNTLTLWRPSDSTSRWWTETDISDQLPFGHWVPGGWAWELAHPIPTTERCPACYHGMVPETPGRAEDGYDRCPMCDGEGSCPPIPAKGKQGVWTP